jgi:hypothetical protein
MPTVKTAKRRPNRLPPSYKRRLARANISHQQVADRSAVYRPPYGVTRPFVSQVLAGMTACPEWFKGMCDVILAEAQGVTPSPRLQRAARTKA